MNYMKTKLLTNNVKKMCSEAGITKSQFIGRLIEAGVSWYTANRIYAGDVNITLTNAAKVASVLNVQSIDQIFTSTSR